MAPRIDALHPLSGSPCVTSQPVVSGTWREEAPRIPYRHSGFRESKGLVWRSPTERYLAQHQLAVDSRLRGNDGAASGYHFGGVAITSGLFQ